MFLATQLNQLKSLIPAHKFRESDFNISNGEPVTIYLKSNPNYKFEVHGNRTVNLWPGQHQISDSVSANGFSGIYPAFERWLINVRRELHAIERVGVESSPDWFESAMPDRYRDLESQQRLIVQELEAIAKIGAVLWQTGLPLNRAVASLFDEVGCKSTLTPNAETYDLTVDIEPGKRLLIEVTGIEGYIQKKSNKITQALDTFQNHADPTTDRVVVAANAHREKSPSERATQPITIATEEALALLTRIGANLVSTTTLFEIWKKSRSDQPGAMQDILKLHALDGGLFTV